MASTKERAWLAAHQKGSKALIAKLDKAHANNPEYQAFKQKHGLGDTSSVKQVSKSQVDAKKEKARQVLAGKAYGATKGTRMGSAEGTGETLRDTIAPLTRDQHSAVKAAEKAAKDAEKPVKPVKAPKPKKEKAAAPAPEKKKPTALELIAAAAAKRKLNQPPVSAKALRRIAAVGDMEHDHGGFEDLGDTQYGGRRSYNEEAIVEGGNYGKPYNNDEDLKSKSNKELQTLHDFWKTRIKKDPNHSRAKGQLTKIKAILAGKIGKKMKEEVEQIDEMKMRVGTIVKLKKPIDGHEYARVKGFTSSSHTRGPTGRGVPMPAGKVTKVHVALKKTKDDAYDPGPVMHIQHDDVHSVISESAVGWMLRQDPKLAKKVRDKIKLAKKRQKQMGTKEPIKEARKKYYQGGAAFADTAARLQGAINKHKERMNRIENGPEDTYHHAGLNLTTKSRVKLPAPWAKVEDK